MFKVGNIPADTCTRPMAEGEERGMHLGLITRQPPAGVVFEGVFESVWVLEEGVCWDLLTSIYKIQIW